MATSGMQHLRDLQMDQYNRQNKMTDAFTESQYHTLDNALQSTQNDPSLSPQEKAGRINQIRQQQLKIMTPGLAKKKLAEMAARFGITPVPEAQTGTVPAQPAMTIGGKDMGLSTAGEQALQGESLGIPTEDGNVPISVPNASMPQYQIPGKAATQVSYKPATTADILGATHGAQFIPVTLSNGTTMMLPAAQAGHLLTTQEANAGRMGVTQAKLDSTESVQNANRESKESIAGANRESRESIAANKAAKPANRDDQAIAIMQREFEAKNPSLTPDQSYKLAYDKWVQETKVAPRVQGYTALANTRVMPTVDPNNPQNVVPMHAGDAIKSGATLPQSIPFQTEKRVQQVFTSGKTADTLTAFNTAIKHIDQLNATVTALQNGNVQLFNRLGNAWATATGSPAPTDFNGIRNAVAGEIAKAFKGSGASDQEIKQIVDTINNTQSPQQLIGATGQYQTALRSKRDVLKQQYEQALQGQPNFGEANASPGSLKQQGAALASGYVRIQDSKGGLHDIPSQNLGAAKQRDPGLKVISQ